MNPKDGWEHHETIGQIREFMDQTKGFKKTLFTISFAIVVQVCTFLFLWGGLTSTVNKNTDFIWNSLAPRTEQNMRNIDKILTRLEFIIDKSQ